MILDPEGGFVVFSVVSSVVSFLQERLVVCV